MVPSDLLPKHVSNSATNLLNGHNHLNGVETVEAKVVVEVRLAVQLHCVSYCVTCCCDPKRTLDVSVT